MTRLETNFNSAIAIVRDDLDISRINANTSIIIHFGTEGSSAFSARPNTSDNKIDIFINTSLLFVYAD